MNYHPADPTAAELLINPALDDNDFEFVELLNTSMSQSINLAGVHFIEQVINDDNQGITFTFGDVDLAPGQRIVIVKDTAAFQIRYGTGITIEGEYSGKLDNGGEAITLRDAAGQTIQQFTYDDDGATSWPTSPDGNGPTLVAVDTSGDYNTPSNWTASNTIHGTPGSAEAAGILGDVTGDGFVGAADLDQILALWGDAATSSSEAAQADLDQSGTVASGDLNIVIANFGNGSPPATPTSNGDTPTDPDNDAAGNGDNNNVGDNDEPGAGDNNNAHGEPNDVPIDDGMNDNDTEGNDAPGAHGESNVDTDGSAVRRPSHTKPKPSDTPTPVRDLQSKAKDPAPHSSRDTSETKPSEKPTLTRHQQRAAATTLRRPDALALVNPIADAPTARPELEPTATAPARRFDALGLRK